MKPEKLIEVLSVAERLKMQCVIASGGRRESVHPEAGGRVPEADLLIVPDP